MKSIKGKFCGGFKPAKTPAHFTPFFGKYARGGGRNTGDSSTTDPQFGGNGTAITPAAPTTPTNPEPGDNNGKKKDNSQGQAVQPGPLPVPHPQDAPADPPGQGDPGGGAEAPDG